MVEAPTTWPGKVFELFTTQTEKNVFYTPSCNEFHQPYTDNLEESRRKDKQVMKCKTTFTIKDLLTLNKICLQQNITIYP